LAVERLGRKVVLALNDGSNFKIVPCRRSIWRGCRRSYPSVRRTVRTLHTPELTSGHVTGAFATPKWLGPLTRAAYIQARKAFGTSAVRRPRWFSLAASSV